MRLDFGKHRGLEVSEVPTAYLRWMVREVDMAPALRAAVLAELRARTEDPGRFRGYRTRGPTPGRATGEGPPAHVQAVVTRWYRQLALDYHPDRGGSDRDMQVVNDCKDRLMQLLQGGR